MFQSWFVFRIVQIMLWIVVPCSLVRGLGLKCFAIYGEVNVSVSVCVEKRETILKYNKVVLFLSPYNVGQAENFWIHPRICAEKEI
jgi:hypothetical protein